MVGTEENRTSSTTAGGFVIFRDLSRRTLRAAIFSSLGIISSILVAFMFVANSKGLIFLSLMGIACCAMLAVLILHSKSVRDALEKTEYINKERYQSIITVSNTGAWEYHSDTGYLWCSPSYFSMLGYSMEEFLKSRRMHIEDVWISLLHPEDVELATRDFERYQKESTGLYESYFRMRHQDGSWKWIWSRGKTLRDENGNASHVTLGTHIDISDKKLLEVDLLEHNAKLIHYSFLTAHEVRGPLARLLGLIQVSEIPCEYDPSWFFKKIQHEAIAIDQVLSRITKELNDIKELKKGSGFNQSEPQPHFRNATLNGTTNRVA